VNPNLISTFNLSHDPKPMKETPKIW